MARAWRVPAALALLALLLAVFAMLRAPDHDESQYVAAAVLTAQGLVPYRDFAWLQTPLQPFALAPLAWLLGGAVWPGLRLANALLGIAALVGVHGAARAAGAAPRVALAVVLLFATCDAFLFGAATARNDMLPLALFALALPGAVRMAQGRAGRGQALLTGLLLGGAAAAKVSYAIPALAFGLWSLCAPRRRHALWIAIGALPAAALVGVLAWLSPERFWFGAILFPLHAPAEFYADQPGRLSLARKTIDVVKFLALGAAPLAMIVWRPARAPVERMLDVLTIAGLVAAVMPTPVWRQYLLPFMAPLFVRAALAWTARPPGRRMRIATAVFVIAGLSQSFLMPWTYPEALRQIGAVRAVMATQPAAAPVVTLSPQFLPPGNAPDPRFAAGPFVFRSHTLLSPIDAERLGVVTRGGPITLAGRPVLVGGEGEWTSGDGRLDQALARAALAAGYSAVPVAGGPFVLLLPPGSAPPK